MENHTPLTHKHTYEQCVIEVKTLRKDIDAIVQRVSSLPKSRETSLAITKLEEGVMWLGMELKRLGEAYGGRRIGREECLRLLRDIQDSAKSAKENRGRI